ncbi:low molecular weight phosphatase family protein [Microbacterium fluvii]|uniref:Low molecular weight phosphatase family protein n=1 Tax=Microbacterium fluvii TaxID=415215 RepID=A0ABW2HLA3_9MICO|nr:low molecular weight phosphatase family protein [Microbacterium fluvii]MCU4673941.1 low molecular weight phosphatase family protein [Microbacterium fluvii]
MSRQRAEPHGILIVCTANRARSVLAEFALREALRVRGVDSIAVESAGTWAVHGTPPMRHAIEVLGEQTAEQAAAFRSRPLTAELIENAGLVLCAERAHRPDVVRLVPRAHRRTFTILQAERLIPDIHQDVAVGDPDIVVALAARLAAARGAGVPSSDDDDIADPAGGPLADYERAGAAIARATAALADALVAGHPRLVAAQ